VSPGTGFYADKVRGQLLKERNDPAPAQLFAHNNLAVCINPVNLKNVLGQIQANRRKLHVGGSPLI
jgi:hypothetical protein